MRFSIIRTTTRDSEERPHPKAQSSHAHYPAGVFPRWEVEINSLESLINLIETEKESVIINFAYNGIPRIPKIEIYDDHRE